MHNLRQMLRAVRFAPLLALLAWAAAGVNAQAFTLVANSKVIVGPTSGYPTAPFAMDGQYGLGPCTIPLVLTFYFAPTINFLTSKTVAACNASRYYDTGTIGGQVPPPGVNAPGGHQVILIVTDTGGGSLQNGTATAAYTINQPPPPPR